jgi:hypothetical protein
MIKLKLRFSVEATKAFEKRKTAKAINCHHSDVLWKFKDTFSCETFTQNSPSFQPIFKLSTRMLNLSKINLEAENFFLSSPR